MNSDTCTECGLPISPARLKALPEATLCIDCASQNDVARTKGYMSWEHKTAPTIIIGRDAESLLSYDQRRFFGSSLKLNSPKNARMGASMENVDLSFKIQNSARRASLRIQEPISIKTPARCHVDRPRVTPNGLCLECATKWYEVRKRS